MGFQRAQEEMERWAVGPEVGGVRWSRHMMERSFEGSLPSHSALCLSLSLSVLSFHKTLSGGRQKEYPLRGTQQ